MFALIILSNFIDFFFFLCFWCCCCCCCVFVWANMIFIFISELSNINNNQWRNRMSTKQKCCTERRKRNARGKEKNETWIKLSILFFLSFLEDETKTSKSRNIIRKKKNRKKKLNGSCKCGTYTGFIGAIFSTLNLFMMYNVCTHICAKQTTNQKAEGRRQKVCNLIHFGTIFGVVVVIWCNRLLYYSAVLL